METEQTIEEQAEAQGCSVRTIYRRAQRDREGIPNDRPPYRPRKCALSDFAADYEHCKGDIDRLELRTGLSRATIYRYVHQLVEDAG